MGKIVKLKNQDGTNIYPVTKTEAVYIENNKTTLKDYLDAISITKNAGPTQTITFDDGADNVPIKSLILNVQPNQEGTGDPSPTNIRPIVGYNEINIEQTGKNLAEGITFTNNEYYGDYGQIISSNDFTRSNEYIPCIGNTNFLFKATLIKSGRLRIHEYDENKAWLRQVFKSDTTSAGEGFFSWTASSDAKYFRFSIANSTGFFCGEAISYPITIPNAVGTAYGCTIDTKNGIFIVKQLKTKINQLTWNYSSGSVWFRTNSLDNLFTRIDGGQLYGDALCSCYKIINATTAADVKTYDLSISVATSLGSYGIIVRDTRYTTVEQLLQNVGNEEIVFTLKTPIVYNIDPIYIKTLLGDNHFQSNVNGTFQIAYHPDLTLYLNKIIGEH